ncbi:hypothetical protein [Lactococcus petauri]|uniref:hypothetical protein n=1 Tax=Lactococcus petauri TaxID=1940789 RepID=UPI001F573FBB|nr:hypothetical protein [Lactococcus petauri]
MYEIKISDLRSLARFGNATVKLDQQFNHKIADIRRDGIYVPHQAIVAKRFAEVKVRESFASIYNNIQTVKQGKVLIAERREGKLVASFQYERRLNEQKSKERKKIHKKPTKEIKSEHV